MKPEEIFRAFAEESVEAILVGGLAATVHGVSRITLDTDFCFRQSPENCQRLAKALALLEAEIYPPRAVAVAITPDLLATHRLVHLRTLGGRLDLLAEIPGLGSYADLVAETIAIEVQGIPVHALSLEQLIRAKEALQQPKDRDHLDQLKAILELRGGREGGADTSGDE